MAFQNITATRLAQVAIPITVLSAYRAPTDTRTFLKDMDIANTTAGAISVSVFIVQVGSTASTANALFYKVPIPGYSTLQWTGSQILNTGDTIQVQATAIGCTVTMTGGEAT
jgi:hypothetical protein